MKDDMDKRLEMALTPMNVPDEKLNNQILWRIKEKEDMGDKRKHYRRVPAAVLVATCILAMGSITAVAAYRYLSPAEVAAEVEDDLLEKAFLSEDAISVNETQECGDYRITLLGSVAGTKISEYLAEDISGIVKDDKIYTVVAIERADGMPMPATSSDEYGEEPFYVSHYIRGLDPNTYSIMSMGGGYQELVKDGIQYRLLEMENIEMFADRGIYVGVNSGLFYDRNAFVYEESTGEMSRNENYQGANALFVLPMDESKADMEAAEAYLEALHNSWNALDEPLERDIADLRIEEFMERLTPENIDEYATPVESTRQVCVPDENGIFEYSWEFESGAGGSCTQEISAAFPDGKIGMSDKFGYSCSETGLEELRIETLTLNTDGTVTFVIYMPIVE